MNLDSRIAGATYGNRQGEPLQQGQIDVGIETDGLKGDKALGDVEKFIAHGGDMLELLVQAEVGENV